MTKTELLELIKNGENSGTEFKRDALDNRSLAKEVVAFANLQGGCILLGVDDDGSIAGLARPDLEEWVMTVCRDKIRPEIIPYYGEIHDAEPGKHVAIVRVDRGWTVHHVWHANHRTYYIRVGSQSREASPEELERLFQQRGAFRLETRPVSGARIQDLDLRRLKDYFQRIRTQEVPMDEDNSGWQALLVNTEILTDEGDSFPPTVAGILLFGKNPNRFLPQAGIDAVAYTGKEKDYTAKERLTIRGPMVPLAGSQGLVENGLVEQAVEFIKRNTGVETALKDGVRREDRWTYPEAAIRETIVNALVHRDYLLSGSDIELGVYEDRLEVGSPGRLPNGITPQRMLSGCRAARNQLLKDIMRDYGYLEHMGMGIPRKIVKSMQAHNGTLPQLIEDDERFIIRLLNPQ
ncbi:MAG: putative DNA binding domain-containing protein [Desulfobacteraceae bacterium]|nr:putative DNA binding domain-containing protein [Desulfobacteraceae bacterium]